MNSILTKDRIILHLPRLAGPETLLHLSLKDDRTLQSADGHQYSVTPSGIALLIPGQLPQDAQVQREHYDRVANDYLTNLGYPHTLEYLAYLDRTFLALLPSGNLGHIAEICCGRGEAIRLLLDHRGTDLKSALGIDISQAMLEAAARDILDPRCLLVQGDATRLPILDCAVDNVFMFGGIHHVNDRPGLFREIHRVLKPGGTFYWREPVSDFWPWRFLRAIIYRLSPNLNYQTERPLLYRETAPVLEQSALELRTWRTAGFIGFCLLMNSDILIVNRLFRFIPGIRPITRAFTYLDETAVNFPFLRHAGLQVFGAAIKATSPK